MVASKRGSHADGRQARARGALPPDLEEAGADALATQRDAWARTCSSGLQRLARDEALLRQILLREERRDAGRVAGQRDLRLRELRAQKLQPARILHANGEEISAQIDGHCTFEDLFSVSGMSRLDTARILAQLIEEGVITH